MHRFHFQSIWILNLAKGEIYCSIRCLAYERASLFLIPSLCGKPHKFSVICRLLAIPGYLFNRCETKNKSLSIKGRAFDHDWCLLFVDAVVPKAGDNTSGLVTPSCLWTSKSVFRATGAKTVRFFYSWTGAKKTIMDTVGLEFIARLSRPLFNYPSRLSAKRLTSRDNGIGGDGSDKLSQGRG